MFLIFGAHSNKAAYFRDDDIIMQDLPFTLPKYVDNLPPTTFESNARTLKVNQIKDFENVVKESVYEFDFGEKINSHWIGSYTGRSRS